MKRIADNKAPDLLGYVKLRRRLGEPVDPMLVHLLVKRSGLGSLRRALQQTGMRGKRGKGWGDHNQLLAAREMWKQIHLTNISVEDAARKVANGSRKATRAYYRFKSRAEQRTLYVELRRDLVEEPGSWRRLAKDEETALNALEALENLRQK